MQLLPIIIVFLPTVIGSVVTLLQIIGKLTSGELIILGAFTATLIAGFLWFIKKDNEHFNKCVQGRPLDLPKYHSSPSRVGSSDDFKDKNNRFMRYLEGEES